MYVYQNSVDRNEIVFDYSGILMNCFAVVHLVSIEMKLCGLFVYIVRMCVVWRHENNGFICSCSAISLILLRSNVCGIFTHSRVGITHRVQMKIKKKENFYWVSYIFIRVGSSSRRKAHWFGTPRSYGGNGYDFFHIKCHLVSGPRKSSFSFFTTWRTETSTLQRHQYSRPGPKWSAVYRVSVHYHKWSKLKLPSRTTCDLRPMYASFAKGSPNTRRRSRQRTARRWS